MNLLIGCVLYIITLETRTIYIYYRLVNIDSGIFVTAVYIIRIVAGTAETDSINMCGVWGKVFVGSWPASSVVVS